MFIPVPVEVKDGRGSDATIPVANGILIAANVLAFFLLGPDPAWSVGPGTSILTVLLYAFDHSGLWHLAGNMLALLVFGTPVNRRLGNGYYLLAYLGTALLLGIFARLFVSGYLVGASGAIFAIVAICLILMPAARVVIYYFALFPITLLIGLLSRPPHWVFWFIRWDRFEIKAYWCLLLVPAIELWGIFWSGWNWTNLAHLFGLVCGVAVVLLLPLRISMGRTRPA